jgi:predicted nucleic acid-binding protein
MCPAPNPAVIQWLNEQDPSSIYLSAVTIAEIHYGLASLAKGRRKRTIKELFDRFVQAGFAERVLPFDEAAATRCGEIMGKRRRAGKPMGVADAQIAAIASVAGFALAARNTKGFKQCGIDLINPFTA